MGIIRDLFKQELNISNKNPINGKPMDGTVAEINGKWKDEYIDILNHKGVKHLFLSTALGWRCDNYDFLLYLKSLETFVVLDGRDISMKQVESLKHLRRLELNTLHYHEIDSSVFKDLEIFYCDAEKPIPSIFECTN